MQKTKPHSGLGMIAVERSEQIYKHGYNLAHDQQYHDRNVLQNAAIAILHQNRKEWPEHDMPIALYDRITGTHTKQEQVAVAGAYLAAMIDYMNIKHTRGRIPFGADMTPFYDPKHNETFMLGEAAIMSEEQYRHLLDPTDTSGPVVAKGCEFDESVKSTTLYLQQMAKTLIMLSITIEHTPTGPLRELLTDVNILLTDAYHKQENTHNESIQDLYAAYVNDRADAIISSEHTVPFAFEAWLRHNNYLHIPTPATASNPIPDHYINHTNEHPNYGGC